MHVRMKATILVFIFSSIPVYGHDLVKPSWRETYGTTYQQWRFDSSANPARPEVSDNSYGNALADITVGKFGVGWLDELTGLGSQKGYWDLGGTGGSIVLHIPSGPGALSHREIWVQVTYFRDISDAPLLEISGAVRTGGETRVIERVATGGKWLLEQSKWLIESESRQLEITLVSDARWGSVVDQIVVDTKSTIGCADGYDGLGRFCEEWLMSGSDLIFDLDESGHVDFRDFGIFVVPWLESCPP